MESEPFKSKSPGPEFNKEELQESLGYGYFFLLRSYRWKLIELKKLQQRYSGALTDPEVQTQINFIDQERHQIHLKLLEVGQKLGKNKSDILIDILLEDGDLSEYGLPEFSLLDMRYSVIAAVRNLENVNEKDKNEDEEEDDLLIKEYYAKEEYKDEYGNFLTKTKIKLNSSKSFLIFDVGKSDEEGVEWEVSKDHNERIKRARVLAKDLGGGALLIETGEYFHESADFYVVAFPKEDLEKVAAIIRNNPKKFRLGKEFYE